MELNLKPVEYFGHKITINPRYRWLAVDSDGALWGYQNEPEVDTDDWCDSWRNTDAFCELICDVDLQGMDWEDTKVKVSP